MNILVSLAIVAIAHQTYCTKLPYYLDKCSLTDPKFDECFERNGKHAVKFILRYGDPLLNVTALTPFPVPTFLMALAKNIQLNTTSGYATVFENSEITHLSLDREKMLLKLNMRMPKISFSSEYGMRLNTLGFLVSGEGVLSYSWRNNELIYNAQLETITIDNVEYYRLEFSETELRAAIDGATFQFTGLEQENKRLGTDVNKLFNKDWPEVVRLRDQFYQQLIGKEFDKILSTYLKAFPKKELFSP